MTIITVRCIRRSYYGRMNMDHSMRNIGHESSAHNDCGVLISQTQWNSCTTLDVYAKEYLVQLYLYMIILCSTKNMY